MLVDRVVAFALLPVSLCFAVVALAVYTLFFNDQLFDISIFLSFADLQARQLGPLPSALPSVTDIAGVTTVAAIATSLATQAASLISSVAGQVTQAPHVHFVVATKDLDLTFDGLGTSYRKDYSIWWVPGLVMTITTISLGAAACSLSTRGVFPEKLLLFTAFCQCTLGAIILLAIRGTPAIMQDLTSEVSTAVLQSNTGDGYRFAIAQNACLMLAGFTTLVLVMVWRDRTAHATDTSSYMMEKNEPPDGQYRR